MKRGIAVLLGAALLLGLLGCGPALEAENSDMLQPVEFYYETVPDEAGGLSGSAIASETRDLGAETLSVEEILALYLKGPEGETLQSPFPQDLALESAELRDGVLTLTFNEAYASLSGVQLTLANACLVYTMTQFSSVESVFLQTTGAMLTDQLSVPLRPEGFLLEDDSAANDQVTVKLYFSDENGRYLAEETRDGFSEPEEDLPAYILQQLLNGPADSDHLTALPEGTSLLGVQLNNGQCVVNFSEEFLLNRPQNYAQARMAVLSVVNSLTELSEIESVRMLCAGQSIGTGYFMDLSGPLYRDETASAKTGGNLYDANLYLSLTGWDVLAPVPAQIRRTASRELALDVLNALIAYDGINGYENPIPDGSLVLDLTVKGDLCQVTFNSAFALCDADEAHASQAVHAVIATLCDLDGINRVQIEIYNTTLTNIDLSSPLTAEPAWILE